MPLSFTCVSEKLLQAGIWVWESLSTQPLGEQLPNLFKQYRKIYALGRSERYIISECIYQIMRYRSWFDVCVQSHPKPSRGLLILSLANMAYQQTGDWLRFLEKIMTEAEGQWLEHSFRVRSLDGQFARKQFPPWLLAKWRASFPGEEQIDQLCHSLLERSPVDIRINSLKTNKRSLCQEIALLGLLVEDAPYAKNGLRFKQFTQLTELEERGYLHIQDAGSQLICELLRVSRHHIVVDLCAGAGGKSLTLAQNMHNTGTIYACDISAFRLGKLKERAKSQGVSNCYTMAVANECDPRLDFLQAKADRVLVDAPCSGTGTLSRNPELKWHLKEEMVSGFAQLQVSILQQAIKMLKPSGARLVYATCSLLKEENEWVAEQISHHHPELRLIPMSYILAQELNLSSNQALAFSQGDYLQIYPHLHGTNGFFACVWESKTVAPSAGAAVVK
ncbi:MAG: RsmB/NOP family class I SAM-dependent RNA methyltransferase [Gammaproteobacteria bacterium]|nr:RsmB/NOP family class I SAM-dependent RNA methyltransferase [Gammaproteobacteria bacterium]